MEVVFIVLTIFGAASALQRQYNSLDQGDDDSGQYVADDSGQYVHDDSGKYVPDHSGEYSPDGSGLYSGDLSGRYSGDQNQFYKENTNDRTFNKKRTSFDNSFGATNLLGFESSINKQRSSYDESYAKDSSFDNSNGENVFGNSPSASSQIGLPKRLNYNLQQANSLSNKYDQSNYGNGKWRIIRQDGDVASDGYHWEYETENGITAQESGKVHNKGTTNEGMKAKGFYQYTGPDNVVIYTGYTADENGFVPVGNHLPTPPPTPIAILKALDYLKSIGKL